MTIAIIDYGSGNLHSAAKAFERAAGEVGGDVRLVVTSDPDVVAGADRVVLPGVGAFADCRRGLDAVSGMTEAMGEAVLERGRPFLGICVGMQLMASRGLEKETTAGLGWNTLHPQREHPLLDGVETGPSGLHAYFVHSYALQPEDQEDVVAVSGYGGPVTAIVARDNIAGTQFHPEKSQTLGLALIGNFLRWRP